MNGNVVTLKILSSELTCLAYDSFIVENNLPCSVKLSLLKASSSFYIWCFLPYHLNVYFKNFPSVFTKLCKKFNIDFCSIKIFQSCGKKKKHVYKYLYKKNVCVLIVIKFALITHKASIATSALCRSWRCNNVSRKKFSERTFYSHYYVYQEQSKIICTY